MGRKLKGLLDSISPMKAALANVELRLVDLQSQSASQVSKQTTPLQRAKEYYYKHQSRRHLFGNSDLFADPAWDILIDIFVASDERQSISISGACSASAVPSKTTLRWIKLLKDAGYISIIDDASDARCARLHLSEYATNKLLRFFSD